MEIAAHRNRMVHFVHAGLAADTEKAQAEREKVVAEQCKGWRQLHILLEKSWADHFGDFGHKIAGIEARMARHRGYLQAKFETTSDERKKHIDAGHQIDTCPTCGFEALMIYECQTAVSSANCAVCWYTENRVSIKCPNPDCGETIELNSLSGPPKECSECKAPIAEKIRENSEYCSRDNEGQLLRPNRNELRVLRWDSHGCPTL